MTLQNLTMRQQPLTTRKSQPNKSLSAQSLLNAFYDTEENYATPSWLCIAHESERFGIAVEMIHSVFQVSTITPAPAAHPAVMGLINLRGRIISLINFATMLAPPTLPSAHKTSLWSRQTLAAHEGSLAVAIEVDDEIYGLLPQTIYNIIHDEELDCKSPVPHEGESQHSAHTHTLQLTQNPLIAKIYRHQSALFAILNLETMIIQLSEHTYLANK